MQRVDTSTAVAQLPAQNAAGIPGYFTQGDPASGLPATVPGQDWCNIVQEELMAIVLAAGITPDKAITNQVLQAIVKLSHYAYLASGTQSVNDSSETITLDFSGASGGFYTTLTGTGRTVTVSNPYEGGVWRFAIKQGTGGNKTITTWPASMLWLGGGVAPTLSTAQGAVDFVTFTFMDGILYGSFTGA